MGFGSLQHYGRALRSEQWHLERQDPHDAFDGWRWGHTHWVTSDSDPCDDWPIASFAPHDAARFVTETGRAVLHGLDFGGRDATFVWYDEAGKLMSCDIKQISLTHGHELTLRELADISPGKVEISGDITAYFEADHDKLRQLLMEKPVASDLPPAYDYQRHNKTRKRRP